MDASRVTRVTPLAALRSPNFLLLWAAQSVSGFGDKITVFALAYVTWQMTGSALSTTAAVVIATLPYAIFGFVGGAVADSLGRRRVMIACDLLRMLAIALIPLTLLLGGGLWIAYLLVLTAAICSSAFNPARMAIVPDLVPADQLGSSNALVYGSDRTIEIVGALVAGVIVAAFGLYAFYVDAATFAVSALLIGRISLREAPPRPVSWRTILAEVTDGVGIIRRSAILRANTIFSMLGQLSIPVVNGLTPVLIFREYHLGPEQLGAVEASIALGAVGGSAVYPAVAGRRPKGVLIIAGFGALGGVTLGIAASPGYGISIALFFLLGAANVAFFVPNVTLSQEVTPPDVRARVFATRVALLNVAFLPVILLTGVLADRLPVQPLFAIAGAFTILVALAGSQIRSLREVP
jgi:MFS family permease